MANEWPTTVLFERRKYEEYCVFVFVCFPLIVPNDKRALGHCDVLLGMPSSFVYSDTNQCAHNLSNYTLHATHSEMRLRVCSR